MIYTITLNFMFQSTKSNFYKTRSGERESQTVVWGRDPSGGSKMVASVFGSLKNNAGVYRNALHSCFNG